MNAYALIPLFASLINFLTCSYIWAGGIRNPRRREYLVFAISISLWCLFDFFLWSPIPSSWVYPMLRIQTVFYIPVGCFFLRFCYALLQRPWDIWSKIIHFFVVIACGLSLLTPLVAVGYRRTDWGIIQNEGPLYLPIILVLAIPLFFGGFLILRKNSEQTSYVVQKQRKIIILGIAVSFTLGFATNIVLPFILEVQDIIQLASTGTAVFSSFIFWALVRYDFLDISVEQASFDVFRNVKDGLILLDSERRFVQINPAAERMLGIELVDIKGKNCSELFPELGEGQDDQFRITARGETRTLNLSQAQYQRNGTILGWTLILREITEILEAENALRSSEQRFRTLAEGLPQAVFEIDKNLKFTWVNKAGFEMFGYHPEILNVGIFLKDVTTEESLKRALESIQKRFRGETLEADEYTMVRRDGSTFPGLIRSEPRFEKGEPAGVFGVVVDISDRKKLEEQLIDDRDQLESQLRQAQKMEAIGRLAGGVAHDFNNALSIIIGCTTLAQRELDQDHPARSDLEKVMAAGERASKITRQLLAFSRKQTLEITVVHLNEVVADLEKMLRYLVRENVEFTIHLEPRIGAVKADQTQLEQVLMNLVVNAIDAMPDGGRLSIWTKNTTIDQEFVASHPGSYPGEYVALEVRDSGHGMDSVILDQIFEPFFTTKEKGKGTGLGLATVYGIVKQHKGYVAVDSKTGSGSTFCVYLPRVSSVEIEAQPREVSQKFIPPRGDKTILLVEDEIAVAALTKSILTKYGYIVTDAPGPMEAIEIVENGDVKIDLLLTDVVMPDMNGRELYDVLKDKIKDLRVLFMSGYTNDVMDVEGLDKTMPFLAKPFSMFGLLKKVGDTIENGS